jgi:hypothetical protein
MFRIFLEHNAILFLADLTYSRSTIPRPLIGSAADFGERSRRLSTTRIRQ